MVKLRIGIYGKCVKIYINTESKEEIFLLNKIIVFPMLPIHIIISIH